ncbi:MAG: response regulator, partial [Planctomycetes bacterium]|nr:response regulator [Planctomycetota bacterium]
MAVRHHIKVLVIDDDPSICKTVGLLLEDHGYNPRTFTNPGEAVDAAGQESFQVALIDLRMPSMDGVEVVERLKRIDERTSCIVMTAYPDLDSATETMRRGTCDYIAKPFKQEELVA